jgi:Flp pilus assembly protein TadD
VPATLIEEMTLLANTGQWLRLEIKSRAVAMRHTGQVAGWRALGKALLKSGKWTQSMTALSRAVKLVPGDAAVHNDLGYVFYNLGREEEAEVCYRRALEFEPQFVEALNNLGALLADLGRIAEAAGILQQSLGINPHSAIALHCLGVLVDRVGGHDDQALAYLERSIALNPDSSDAYVAVGNILLRTGKVAESTAMFRCARELRPLITWHARKEKADFSALFLYAPGSGCTPVNYLVGKAPYDCHFYCVLPDVPTHLDTLLAQADVVVNMIADADYGREILPAAQELVERLGCPTLNPPCQIMKTDRATVALRLAAIPLCHIPKTVRLPGPEFVDCAKKSFFDGFALPLLVRLAGNHGGDDFDKFSDLHAIIDFVARRPEADYYLTQYLDYRSNDGFFRKYRLISIDGELFPYHLAIHDDWKVHHFRTDMANHAWMRQEEEAFLRAPHLVFGGLHQATLRGVAAATGLDYCGIDCALDRNGAIVVFEANASMLVHDEKSQIFAYKNPYIAKIKAAFDAKLARLAFLRE